MQCSATVVYDCFQFVILPCENKWPFPLHLPPSLFLSPSHCLPPHIISSTSPLSLSLSDSLFLSLSVYVFQSLALYISLLSPLSIPSFSLLSLSASISLLHSLIFLLSLTLPPSHHPPHLPFPPHIWLLSLSLPHASSLHSLANFCYYTPTLCAGAGFNARPQQR